MVVVHPDFYDQLCKELGERNPYRIMPSPDQRTERTVHVEQLEGGFVLTLHETNPYTANMLVQSYGVAPLAPRRIACSTFEELVGHLGEHFNRR